jgi:hypothetical protein
MPDIQRYWQLVAEQRARLLTQTGVSIDGLSKAEIAHLARQDSHPIFITSLDRPLDGITGGATSGVTVEIAARRLVESSHRLATEEEIAKFHADQKARDRECAQIEFRRKQERGGTTFAVQDRDTAEELGLIPPRSPESPKKR